MPIITSKNESNKDPSVPLMLTGGRVTTSFRDTLFAAAGRAGISVNEYVIAAAAEKLRASGSYFSGVFDAGDLDRWVGKRIKIVDQDALVYDEGILVVDSPTPSGTGDFG